MVVPSRAPPVLMQQQQQQQQQQLSQFVEPLPPKGFVWSTFEDMEGSVLPTSFSASPTPARADANVAPSSSAKPNAAVALKPPAAMPVERSTAAPISVQETPMTIAEPPASKSRLVLPLCMLGTLLCTGGIDVLARTVNTGFVSILALVLKLGWRFGFAFGLCSAFRARESGETTDGIVR